MLGEFAKRLRYYRKLAGFKQAKDFAKALGVKYSTYTPYEQGREPNYELLCRIAGLLHVSTDELLGNIVQEQSEDGQWLPKHGESYYVPGILKVIKLTWNYGEFDIKCYDNHMICRTPEKAKEKLAKMLDALKEDA